MCTVREGETAAADPSSREQQQQYAFNKNKYSSRYYSNSILLLEASRDNRPNSSTSMNRIISFG
jgi:hypothetical protein